MATLVCYAMLEPRIEFTNALRSEGNGVSGLVFGSLIWIKNYTYLKSFYDDCDMIFCMFSYSMNVSNVR